MFNTECWSGLTEKTYGYKSKVFSHDGFELHYSHVINGMGEYLIAPSFGDYIEIQQKNIRDIDKWAERNRQKPIKLKVCMQFEPQLKHFEVQPGGFIHQIEYDSYEFWNKEIIRCKFRNQINQAIKNGLTTKVSNRIEDLRGFWEMHAILRINKFKEIPQPWDYFENIYAVYFTDNKGYVIQAFDKKNNLLGGVLFLVANEKAYYKFSASYITALKLRPNNLIMDRLIRFLDDQGIKSLNLGYTGSSDAYSGLRKYKLYAGAREYTRYILQTSLFNSLDRSKIKCINDEVQALISNNPTLDEVNQFSQKYYKYFI